MAEKRLPVQILIRHSTSQNWLTKNPTLEQGEFGLETNTFLIKVGDGIRDWIHLPYLNQLNETYFKRTDEGALTFSDEFQEILNNLIAGAGGGGKITIPDMPTDPTDAANKAYVDWAVAHAGHLTRAIVQELPTEEIDEYTIYMIQNSAGTGYDEYMYIQGSWDMVGQTGSGGGGFVLEPATESRLGGVKASSLPNYVNVTQEGFMTLNDVSVFKLYIPDGDVLVIDGGRA